MRRFIAHGAVFAAILLMVNAGLLVFANNAYFRSYEAISLDYEAYLLGDSHAAALIDFLEPIGAYNLGEESDSYEDMLLKASFLAKRSSARLLIISADDHTLSLYREDNNNADRSVFFSTPTTFGNPIEWFERRFVARYFVLLNPKVRDVIRSRIKSLFRGKVARSDRERTKWSDFTGEIRFTKTSKRSKQQFPGTETSVRNDTALNDILSLCAERGITAVGIKYPLTEEYSIIVEPLSYGADEVFAKHGVPVLDYTHTFDGQPNLFKDQDHLNVYGAEKFADIIRKDILEPFANGEFGLPSRE